MVAIITDGGTGFGRALALARAENGTSKVFIIGRREQPLVDTAAKASARNIMPVVTTHIDLVIVNSGVPGTPPTVVPSSSETVNTLMKFRNSHWAQPMGQFSHVLNVNVTGTHYTILALLTLLHEAHKRLIVTSSVAGIMTYPVDFAYTFSTAALMQLVPVWAARLWPYQIWGVRSVGSAWNGVERGSVDARCIPVTQAGAEEDLVGMMMWMASIAGGYLNGQTIVLDGRWSKIDIIAAS
ncbi:hypothetical protein BJX96DRAFT_183079 [Aspergillus floccosus]